MNWGHLAAAFAPSARISTSNGSSWRSWVTIWTPMPPPMPLLIVMSLWQLNPSPLSSLILHPTSRLRKTCTSLTSRYSRMNG